MTELQAWWLVAGSFFVAAGLFTIAGAIRQAAKWIGEALWHGDFQIPPQWWKR